MSASAFGEFVARARAGGELIVQPRMGFARVEQMRDGLRAVKAAGARTIGTVTLDSYTRVGDHASAEQALRDGQDLNGFPIVAHGAERTRDMLAGIAGADFPVQVRHGSPLPYRIFETLVSAGVGATEGGPISYCLPYSRTPLADAIADWARCCGLLAREAQAGNPVHLESFGGCLLGQLCPPSLLIAVSVLEGIFFRRYGVPSVSLSYAQQTNFEQDLEAVRALRALAGEYLDPLDWHVVLYTYMGVFPRTRQGALDILALSARLAVEAGAERLIVKTPVEAQRIPTIQDNVEALEHAARAERSHRAGGETHPPADTGIAAEARALIENVLSLDRDLGRAIQIAFKRGQLDVPYCLHADNAGRARSFIDERGRLCWADVGAMPIALEPARGAAPARVTARGFLTMLSFVEQRFDAAYLAPADGAPALAAPRGAVQTGGLA
jgi:methylaspartate mutase epsilon subunit